MMNVKYRLYSYHKDGFGWMVVSINIDGTDERMEMCYTNEEAAASHAMTANQNEPKRYAEAKKREEEDHKRFLQSLPTSPYYSCTGYYGD